MKTIYVTVAEFLENGGILQDARPIYNESGIRMNCDEWFWRHYTEKYPDTTYIKIECTPIYK